MWDPTIELTSIHPGRLGSILHLLAGTVYSCPFIVTLYPITDLPEYHHMIRAQHLVSSNGYPQWLIKDGPSCTPKYNIMTRNANNRKKTSSSLTSCRLSRLYLSTQSLRELCIEVLVVSSDNNALLWICFAHHLSLVRKQSRYNNHPIGIVSIFGS